MILLGVILLLLNYYPYTSNGLTKEVPSAAAIQLHGTMGTARRSNSEYEVLVNPKWVYHPEVQLCALILYAEECGTPEEGTNNFDSEDHCYDACDISTTTD